MGYAAVSTSHAATGSGTTIAPVGYMNYSLSGTFVGTILVERSFDGGTTYVTWRTDTAVAEAVIQCPEVGVLYRTRCSAYTSGTAVARLGY